MPRKNLFCPSKIENPSNCNRKASLAVTITGFPYKNHLAQDHKKFEKRHIRWVSRGTSLQGSSVARGKYCGRKTASSRTREGKWALANKTRTQISTASESTNLSLLKEELTPKEEDARCIFSEAWDTRGEALIKCVRCEMWCRSECTGCHKSQLYIYDYWKQQKEP
jgi:hypothetical protein